MKQFRKPLSFKTYQDVKYNLALYTIMVLNLFAFFVYFSILPEAHRTAFEALFQRLATFPVLDELSLIVVFSAIAYFLVYGLEIHDKVYDRFVIRWRRRYDLEFIIPQLVRPFIHKLDPMFFKTAEANRYRFMEELFYLFVMDYEPKIPVNRLVRFYERITKYWATQFNEIFLVILVTVIYAYRFLYTKLDLPVTSLLDFTWLALALIILNRLVASLFLKEVRMATEDEMRAIHSGCMDDLESRVREVSREFNLRYQE